jgi:hypothetical protein
MSKLGYYWYVLVLTTVAWSILPVASGDLSCQKGSSLWYTVPHKEHARLFANERLIRPTGTGNTGYF